MRQRRKSSFKSECFRYYKYLSGRKNKIAQTMINK